MPTIKLYNPISKKLEPLVPLEKGHVRVYSCGPTVYDYAHIGNYRAFLFSDMLHRVLKFFGYKVSLIMNLTDIDDKTIRGANEKKVSLSEFTDPFEKAFFDDISELSMLKASYYPRATEFIAEMIAMIEILIKKKHAYLKDGSVYFRIASFPSYGKLSHIRLEDQQVGASGRVETEEYEKEAINDFVLWKATNSDEAIACYDSPFGPGRPGWHIECSAMSKHYLGNHFDIHTGGIDNRFPHHENEIAQSECCNGTAMANHWLHVAHLLIDGEKMSKSLGNFLTLKKVKQRGIAANTLRFMLLSTHYRNSFNFTDEGAKGAQKAILRLQRCVNALYEAQQKISERDKKQTDGHDKEIATQHNKMTTAFADDLNASAALAAIFDAVTLVNHRLHDKSASAIFISDAIDFFKQANSIFVFQEKETPQQREIPQEVQEILHLRKKARVEKDFAQSDALRDRLESMGYSVQDTENTTKIERL